jgi:hypothetical protein
MQDFRLPPKTKPSQTTSSAPRQASLEAQANARLRQDYPIPPTWQTAQAVLDKDYYSPSPQVPRPTQPANQNLINPPQPPNPRLVVKHPPTEQLAKRLNQLKQQPKKKKRQALVAFAITAGIAFILGLGSYNLISNFSTLNRQAALANTDKTLELLTANQQQTLDALKQLETDPKKLKTRKESLTVASLIKQNQDFLKQLQTNTNPEQQNLIEPIISNTETLIKNLERIRQAYQIIECHNQAMEELQNINQNLQSIAQNFVQSLKDKDLVGHLKTIDDILQQIQILFNNTQTHQNCFLKDSFFDTSEITKELKNLQNQIVKLQELYTDYKNAIQNQNTIEAVKMAKEINSFTIEFQLQTDPEAVFQKKIQELIQTQINWLEASLKTVAKK